MINFAIKLAATVAMEALQMGLQASKRTKGPRLDELAVTVSEYGTPLPRFKGARKFSCPVFHAEPLKEIEKNTKVKGGGKQTTYHYLATFACAIADCEIDKVLKIFFDDTLVYDATGVGPISYAASLGIDLNTVMRIYTGSETQNPDPRYVTYCEDKYGPNSAPAYRGVSYLFFEELPTDNFGNRIPQVTVIATSGASTAFPWEYTAAPTTFVNTQLSPDGTRLYAISSNFMAWDVPSRTMLHFETFPTSVGNPYAITPDAIYAIDGLGDTVFQIGLDGGMTQIGTSTGGWNGVYYAGGQVLFTPGSFAGQNYGLLSGSGITPSAAGFWPSYYFTNTSGEAIVFGSTDLTGTAHHLVIGKIGATTTIDTSAYGTTGGGIGFDNGTNYVVRHGSYLFLIDKTTYAIVLAVNAPSGTSSPTATYNSIPPGSSYWWDGLTKRSATDLSVLETATKTDWSGSTRSGESVGSIFSFINDALISTTTDPGVIWRYVDRQASGGTTLGAIVSAMCDAANLTSRDTSALTQTVGGYSWTRGDVKSQMEPILDIHDVDARPHDFEIEFLPRGSAPSGTLLTRDFVKAGDQSARYKVTIQQDTDLAVILRVNFADSGADQQTNNVITQLPADSVDTRRDDTIDMTTYAATPNEAQQLGDRYLRREWNSRETVENALTAQCLAYEPGDVTTLDLDGIDQNVRLTKQTFSSGQIQCTFVRDEVAFAAVNTASTGSDMTARDPAAIVIPPPIRGFVIDAPYREDSDADIRPLLYAGAGSYAGLTFGGSVIWEATGSPLAYDTLFDSVTTGATWGTCTTTLGSVASPWLWDRGNKLTVSLQSGSLTSASEADINADPTLNLLLIGSPANGWEYVNFTTATLNGDGTYMLSGFKRGRRGTEWACGTHATGDAFVLAASLDPKEMGADEVGGSKSFKAQSVGRSLDSSPAITFTYAGDTLKPYAPARVKWTSDGTNLYGEIIRRTRIGGAWVGGSTIPLSENSEAYEVEIYHSGVLKRTISVTGTNLFTYASADIAADGNSVGTPPAVHVYQLSDTVGRGFALAA